MTRPSRSLLLIIPGLVAFAVAVRRSGQIDHDALEPLRPQGAAVRSRALSDARLGRDATLPQHIPAWGWWEIAKRTVQKFSENQLMSEAASVTFFALLSVFPAVTALVSIYGLFTDSSTIARQLDSMSGFMPDGGLQIIRDQVQRLTQTPSSGLGLGLVLGVLAALWSANQGSKAMFSALNDVYGEREARGFVKLTAISLAFTVGGVVILLIGIGVIAVLPPVFKAIGLAGDLDMAIRVLRWPMIVLVITLALAVLYRYGPSRNPARWTWVTWGGAIAAVVWVALSFAFSWYVSHFGNYNKTYGSLGAIIGFMTWIWLSSTVLLLGGQINAEMETQTARDTTGGAEKPLGSRRAAAADTVS